MAFSVGWKTFTVARKARGGGGGGGGMELSFVAAEGGSHSRDSLAPRLRRVSQNRSGENSTSRNSAENVSFKVIHWQTKDRFW